MIKFAIISAAIAISLSSNAAARPANELERYYLGRYIVKSEDSARTICQVEIAWADDVGGQFVAHGCEAVPAIAESARWHFDPDTGEARFEDALRKPHFRLAETEAGFIAILPDENRYWFELPPRPEKTRSRR